MRNVNERSFGDICAPVLLDFASADLSVLLQCRPLQSGPGASDIAHVKQVSTQQLETAVREPLPTHTTEHSHCQTTSCGMTHAP